MEDLARLTEPCRRVVDETLVALRAKPVTAASRAQQIQALTIRRTLEDWRTRAPFPEQPPRLARMARDLGASVLGEVHPLVVELRRWSGSQQRIEPVSPGKPAEAPVRVCVACRRCESGRGPACSECGGELSTIAPANVVDGRYVLTRELGRGGMGVVHEGIDIFLERAVAVKLIASERALTGALLTKLRREATALAAVRNDHVVQVYAFGVHGHDYYLAMEHVLGRDLGAILEAHEEHGGTLPVPLAVALLVRVASGVAAVHDAGLLHRDLKPRNILIEERTGRAVLIDFGLALRRQSSERVLGGGELPGTPLYMAPELLGGPPEAGPWNASDLYSLGCTAFEMLTGQPPGLGASLESLLQLRRRGPPPRASSVRPGVAAFDDVLLKALARDPNDRYRSALDLARDLELALKTWLAPEPTHPALPRVGETLPSPGATGPASPSPTATAEAPLAPVSDAHAAIRVLVVDDDMIFQKLATRCVEMAFAQCPVRVEAAASSEAAVTAAGGTMPDLVILDYCMPREDGVAALTRLRGLPLGDRPRVVVVSASVPEAEKWRFEALGVNDFVVKPVRLQAFVELLADVATRAGWQNALIAPPRARPS